MTNPYRDMCSDLIDALDAGIPAGRIRMSPLADRARALLAQPVAEGPTDEELWAAGSDDFRANCYPTDAIAYARAVLARWGTSNLAQVRSSVGDHQPLAEDDVDLYLEQ